jgi:hypothetical protein
LAIFASRARWIGIVVAVLGLVVNLASVMKNWQLVLATSPAARDPLTPYPAAVIDCWRMGGEDVFPDLLLCRLAQSRPTGATTRPSAN